MTLIGKTIEYNGSVFTDGQDEHYSGLLAIEEYDSNERGHWINAVMLDRPLRLVRCGIEELEDSWTTLDSGFNYGDFVLISGEILPNIDGIKAKVTDDFDCANMELGDLLERIKPYEYA